MGACLFSLKAHAMHNRASHYVGVLRADGGCECITSPRPQCAPCVCTSHHCVCTSPPTHRSCNMLFSIVHEGSTRAMYFALCACARMRAHAHARDRACMWLELPPWSWSCLSAASAFNSARPLDRTASNTNCLSALNSSVTYAKAVPFLSQGFSHMPRNARNEQVAKEQRLCAFF